MGNGSEWTKLYKPIKILETYDSCSNYDEDKILFETMERFGIDNVRGGSFVQINLSKTEKEFLEKRIISATNKCFKCKSSDHFVKDCPVSNYPIVKNKKINYNKLQNRPCVVCYICKKPGHYANECKVNKNKN